MRLELERLLKEEPGVDRPLGEWLQELKGWADRALARLDELEREVEFFERLDRELRAKEASNA